MKCNCCGKYFNEKGTEVNDTYVCPKCGHVMITNIGKYEVTIEEQRELTPLLNNTIGDTIKTFAIIMMCLGITISVIVWDARTSYKAIMDFVFSLFVCAISSSLLYALGYIVICLQSIANSLAISERNRYVKNHMIKSDDIYEEDNET
jgi:hypothetical protein